MQLASLLAFSQCCKADSCIANLPVSEDGGSFDSPCCDPMEMPCFYQQASLPNTNSCRFLLDVLAKTEGRWDNLCYQIGLEAFVKFE